LQGHGCKECGILSRVDKQSSNTQHFTQGAIKKHGDRYDYSSVNYINSMSKVVIICKLHGKFSQRADDHLYGKGCKECGILSRLDKVGSNKQKLVGEVS
jgi:hypothetical protein